MNDAEHTAPNRNEQVSGSIRSLALLLLGDLQVRHVNENKIKLLLGPLYND